MSSAVVDQARSWLGTPFHHQNRVKHAGVDCIGLVVCVFSDLGWAHEDQQYYPRVPSRWVGQSTLQQLLAKYCDPVSQPQPGDIGYTELMGAMPHVYIVADGGISTELSLIHAYSTAGQVVEVDLTHVWLNRTISFWRHKNG